MRFAAAGIRLAVLALPPVVRRRYREEWSADLTGARELGLSTTAVVAGAIGTVLSIDRTDPVVTGLPRSVLRHRRGRWAAALLAAAALLVAGATLHGYDAASVLGVIMTVIVAVCVLGGCWMLTGVFRIRSGGAPGPEVPEQVEPASAPQRWVFGVAFALATLAAVTAGLLHIAVWNPVAKVPGSSLDEIYAAMAAAGEGAGTTWLVAWGLVAVGGSTAYLAQCGRRSSPLTRRMLLTRGLLLFGGMITVGWFAGFAMGMGLADTFATDGGDAAPSGPVLAFTGHLALTCGLILGLAPPERSRRIPLLP